MHVAGHLTKMDVAAAVAGSGNENGTGASVGAGADADVAAVAAAAGPMRIQPAGIDAGGRRHVAGSAFGAW